MHTGMDEVEEISGTHHTTHHNPPDRHNREHAETYLRGSPLAENSQTHQLCLMRMLPKAVVSFGMFGEFIAFQRFAASSEPDSTNTITYRHYYTDGRDRDEAMGRTR